MALPVGVITGLIELAKLGLQGWFQALRMAGKTDEEIDVLYNKEKQEFLSHHPDTLPDVPSDDGM